MLKGIRESVRIGTDNLQFNITSQQGTNRWAWDTSW